MICGRWNLPEFRYEGKCVSGSGHGSDAGTDGSDGRYYGGILDPSAVGYIWTRKRSSAKIEDKTVRKGEIP